MKPGTTTSRSRSLQLALLTGTSLARNLSQLQGQRGNEGCGAKTATPYSCRGNTWQRVVKRSYGRPSSLQSAARASLGRLACMQPLAEASGEAQLRRSGSVEGHHTVSGSSNTIWCCFRLELGTLKIEILVRDYGHA